MSWRVLERHYQAIDEAMETIRTCEAFLDTALLSSEDDLRIGAISVLPPPPSLSLDLGGPETDLATAVAQRIKAARQQKGWRQKDLAEATGIARPNIARLESGQRLPKITTLHKIGQALGVSVEMLLGASQKISP